MWLAAEDRDGCQLSPYCHILVLRIAGPMGEQALGRVLQVMTAKANGAELMMTFQS